MATSSRVVIVDSSAIISLVNVADQLHTKAIAINETMLTESWTVLVPSEVFAEALNAIGKKLGRKDATLVGRILLERHAAGELEFTHAEPGAYAKALDLQARGAGGPSFVDCLVMALADAHGTSHIFGFDATFRKNGYRLPEEAKPIQSAA